jgi:DNA-binding MarR family transcriptional regulator
MWDSRVGVMIFAPQEKQRSLEEQVHAAGLRLLQSATLDEAGGHTVIGPHVVLLDVPLDDVRHDPLLDTLDRASADGHVSLVVRTEIANLDPIAAQIASTRATILCDPSEEDMISGLRAAAGSRNIPVRFFDGARDHEASKDQPSEIHDEVERLVDAFERAPGPAVIAASDDEPAPDVDPARLAKDIHAILRLRRERDDYFQDTLFADPAWDMLLELLEARLLDQQLSITGLCASAGVPTTTALRWLNVLVAKGLIERKRDVADRRRVYVEITDVAADALCRWFARARTQLGLTEV